MHTADSRVRLVPLRSLDSRAWRRIHEHFRDPEIAHLNGTPPNRVPLWMLRSALWLDNLRSDRELFGVIADDDEFIGLVQLYDIRQDTGTMGIIIGEKEYWGRGYGTEAVRQLLEIAFTELGLKQVKLSTYVDNPRAQASFKKAGFRELHREVKPGDRDRLSIWMSIPKERWQAEFRNPPPRRTP